MYVMYLRKSRSDGGTVDEVLKKHYDILTKYANEKGIEIPADCIFKEIASGEMISERPQMQRVLELVSTSRVDGVLVVDISRLTRGSLTDCGKIMDVFQFSSTAILTPKHTYYIYDNDIDRKMCQMEMLHGADYLAYMREIMERGKRYAVEHGRPLGYAPYGYKQVNDGKLVTYEIIPEEADVVRTIYNMYAGGDNLNSIARYLNDAGITTHSGSRWTATAVKRLLENPAYCGKLRYGKRPNVQVLDGGEVVKKRTTTTNYNVYDGNWTPIIDEELYQSVQGRIGNNARVRAQYALSNPLAGLVKCPMCGRTMQLSGGSKRYGKIHLTCYGAKVCRARTYLLPDVYARTIAVLHKNLEDYMLMDNGSADDGKRKTLETQLATLKRKIPIIYSAFENGIYSPEEFSRRRNLAEQEIAAVQEQIDDIPTANDVADKITTLHNALDMLAATGDDELTPRGKNEILKSIVSSIEIVTTETIDTARSRTRDYSITVHTLL